MFAKENVDYTLYLVTDSTMLPEGTTLESQVEAGLKNGVTLVQLREKETPTKTFIQEALKVQKLCKHYGVPLIINDRVDVALAINADGVHVGQDDMPIPMVRKLLGPEKIIGWSVGYTHEVEQLTKWGPEGVDYIGIGMVFPTNTKKNPKKAPMGPVGVSNILGALQEYEAKWCKTVAIGGLHPDCIPRVLYQCGSPDGRRMLDGISVVSDIMAAPDAGSATKKLRDILAKKRYDFIPGLISNSTTFHPDQMAEYLDRTKTNRPLIQHITNKVHQNFGANVTLALGSSPIMSEINSEFKELSLIPHATLLLNTGSVAPLEVLIDAVKAYNESQRPIVFDPVGYSATETRLNLNNHVLTAGQFACIKGNSGEILSLAGLSQGKMKGVDSGYNGSDLSLLIKATKIVAYRYRTVSVCTGKTDIVADGTFAGAYEPSGGMLGDWSSIPCFTIVCGDIPIMECITASGCSLGSTIACLIGGVSGNANVLGAVLTAVTLYKSAGQKASSRCRGSGSFHVELIDALYQFFTSNQPLEWAASIHQV
ncbi:LAFE_0C04214g1_1 [Lachancea fermentati]|uniref:LAFE_0C04214g1_1 n=1 Tax=Lachancea fermentati TaxID=4955 RepID=A0A1G4M988_LACFM|nr:LAFE_0C04214g1_1 [Lachancea fermentati]